jgi:SAM-dependent methyltransferase
MSSQPDGNGTVAVFWDRRASGVAPSVRYWTDYPPIRSHVNRLVTDAWWAYPTHGFKAGWAYRPLARGLSIGCGTGNLERDLRWLRICEEVDAFDVSPESIRIAREVSDREGIDRVRYEVGDCERMDYPCETYDAVFFHGSLHHMFEPRRLLERLVPALRPGGLLFLDEYVGPSRHEWRPEHLRHAQESFDQLPESWRVGATVEPPYDVNDPSEMAASSTILPAVRELFDVQWERAYWGNLLMPLLCRVDAREAGRPESEAILLSLIEREQELVRTGEIVEPLFAWLVGRRRSSG